MIRRPPRAQRPDSRCPFTTLFRSEYAARSRRAVLHSQGLFAGDHAVGGAVGDVRRRICATDAAGRGAGCGREQRPPQPRLARRPARTAYRATDRSAAAAFAGQAEQEHRARSRSEEHTSELQSLMRISYAVFCLKKKQTKTKA